MFFIVMRSGVTRALSRCIRDVINTFSWQIINASRFLTHSCVAMNDSRLNTPVSTFWRHSLCGFYLILRAESLISCRNSSYFGVCRFVSSSCFSWEMGSHYSLLSSSWFWWEPEAPSGPRCSRPLSTSFWWCFGFPRCPPAGPDRCCGPGLERRRTACQRWLTAVVDTTLPRTP